MTYMRGKVINDAKQIAVCKMQTNEINSAMAPLHILSHQAEAEEDMVAVFDPNDALISIFKVTDISFHGFVDLNHVMDIEINTMSLDLMREVLLR